MGLKFFCVEGFMVGEHEAHRQNAAYFVLYTGSIVAAVDYRPVL